MSPANLGHALVDTVRVLRAATSSHVVHIQTALLPSLPLLRALALCAAARLGGAGVICHVHSGRLNSGQTEAFAPSTSYRVLLHALRLAHRVVVVAEPGAVVLRELVPALRVRTIHNAVDVASFMTATPDGDPPRAIYVGTLSRRKGLADLVDALSILDERGVVLRVAVIGGAAEVGEDECAQLRRRAGESPIPLELLGSLGAPQVRAQLAASDLFVLPSHWEGQPIAILEAMASGLPVVTTRVGANPDVVRDGVDGLLVPPHDPAALADAMERLARDNSARVVMGAAAREHAAASYDRSRLRRDIIEEYDAAGQQSRRGREGRGRLVFKGLLG